MIESYQEVCKKQTPRCAFLEKGSRTIDLLISGQNINVLRNSDYLVFHVHAKKFQYGKVIILLSSAQRWILMPDKNKEEIIKAYHAEAEVLPLLLTDEHLNDLENQDRYTVRFRCLKEHYNLIVYVSRAIFEGLPE